MAELLPEHQRTHGRPRVDLIRAVAHANDARLAARTGSRVGRAICVGQHHAPASLAKMMSGPCAEDTGADHGYVVEHALAAILTISGRQNVIRRSSPSDG